MVMVIYAILLAPPFLQHFSLYIFKPARLRRIFQPQLVLACWCQHCSQTEAQCLWSNL